MVSIFAQTVYDETVTNFSVSDGDSVEDAFSTLPFPQLNLTQVVGGFAYIESGSIEITHSTLEVSNETNNDRFLKFEFDPSYVYDNSLDLFSNISEQSVQSNTNIPDNFSHLDVAETHTINYTIDTYIDTPATLSPNVTFTNSGGKGDLTIYEDQTISSINIKINFVGRIP